MPTYSLSQVICCIIQIFTVDLQEFIVYLRHTIIPCELLTSKIYLPNFLIELIFRSVLVHSSTGQKVQGFPIYPRHHKCITSPIISIPHQSGTFVITDERTLTNRHPKSIVYVRVHSWYCALYGFRQMYNDMYPPYSIIQSSFTALRILCAPPIHRLLPDNLWQP